MTQTRPAVSTVEPVVDHPARLRRFVLSQFRGDTVIDPLIQAIGQAIQRVENDHFDLYLSSQLGLAAGVLLDQWGALVGEVRGGLDDDNYRVFIEARILLNLTDCGPGDVQRIAEIITQPSTVRIYPYATWGYQVIVVRTEFMGAARAARVGRFLRLCKPGGVPIDITEQRPGDFGFAGYGGPFNSAPFARSL